MAALSSRRIAWALCALPLACGARPARIEAARPQREPAPLAARDTAALDASLRYAPPVERAARSCPAALALEDDLEAPEPIRPSWWSPPRGAITRCPQSSAAYTDARARIDALERAIDALRPGDDVSAVRSQLTAVLDHRCLALGSIDDELPAAITAHSIEQWWTDGGGGWVDDLLGEPANNGPFAGHVSFAPTEQRSLVLEEQQGSALVDILCPAESEPCGRETAPFALRFRELLRGRDAIERQRREARLDDPRRDDETWSEACERTALARPTDQRYATWRQCISEHEQPRQSAPPSGYFRAPTGWLIVQGRRGHHSYCDSLRVVHLASGASFEAKTCSAMSFVRRFRGDADVEPQLELRTGTASATAMQEATLAMVLAPFVTRDARAQIGLEVPAGIAVRYGAPQFGGLSASGWFSSDQSTLRWSWISSGCLRAHGTLRWPESADPANSAAAHLLAVAEATVDEAQSPAVALPRWVVPSPASEHEDDPQPALAAALSERLGQ
jgi:hypothetical protein